MCQSIAFNKNNAELNGRIAITQLNNNLAKIDDYYIFMLIFHF
jgi:hypothetical protein